MSDEPQNHEIANAWNFGPNHSDMVSVGQIVNSCFKEFNNGKYYCSEGVSEVLELSKETQHRGMLPNDVANLCNVFLRKING